MIRTLKSLAPLFCAAVLLSACMGGGASAPTHYYVLTSTGSAPSPGGASAAAGPSVDLARVALPEYLNQSSIVTRGQGNEVMRSEFDLWAGPLADEVTRTLGENLALALPTDRLSTGAGRRGVATDFVVEVEIVAFERDAANTVQLVARWSVSRDDGRNLIAMRRTAYKEAATADYGSTAAAMSRVLAALSTDIAAAISKSATARAGTPASPRAPGS